MDRNVTMLQKLVQGAVKNPVKNIVVVTTGGDQNLGTAVGVQVNKSKLPDHLRELGHEKPLVYDGTKLSALIILENATKKTPILLDLKKQTPSRTDAPWTAIM